MNEIKYHREAWSHITSVIDGDDKYVHIVNMNHGREYYEWRKGPANVKGSKERNWNKSYPVDGGGEDSFAYIQFKKVRAHYINHFFNPQFENIFAS